MNWISFYTLCRREIDRFLRVWTQSFLPPVISAVLYIIVFGRFIGSRIGEVDGVPYIEFLIPGLIIMNVITSTYGGTAFSVFFSKWEKSIHDVLTSPLSYMQMVGAILLGAGLVRGAMVAASIAAVLALFGGISVVYPLIALLFLMLTALFFGSFGLVVGLWAQRFDHFNVIQTFIITPLIYLGGVFYSLDSLPQQFQVVSHFNPLLYMINGFRYGMVGHSDTALWLNLTVLGTMAVVMMMVCVWLFRRGYNLRT